MRNKRTLQRGLSLLLAGGMALSSVGVTPALAEEYDAAPETVQATPETAAEETADPETEPASETEEEPAVAALSQEASAPVATYVDETADDGSKTISIDFSQMENLDDLGGWQLLTAGGTVTLETDPADPNSKALAIKHTSNPETGIQYDNLGISADTYRYVTVSETFYLTSPNVQNSQFCLPYIFGGADGKSVAYTLLVDGTAWNTYKAQINANKATKNAGTAKHGEWQTIDYVIDLQTKKFSVKLNGETTLENATPRTSVDQLTKFKFYSDDGNRSTVYLKSVTIKAEKDDTNKEPDKVYPPHATEPATYYVSNDGDDDAAGTSPETAWKTIDRVNAETFIPGDKILFERGGEWDDKTLSPKGSGSVDAYITIGAYGDSTARPKIAANGKVEDALYLHNQQYWEISELDISNTVEGFTMVTQNGENPTDNVTERKSEDGKKLGDYRGIHIAGNDVATLTGFKIHNVRVHDVSGVVSWIGDTKLSDDGIVNNAGYDDSKRTGGILIESTAPTNNTPTVFSDITIEKCEFVNNSFGGIIVKQYNNGKNQENGTGWANRNSANKNGAPNYTDNNWHPHTNIIIRDNYINQGASAYACNGIYLCGVKDSVIEKNVLEHIGTCGIELFFADNVAVQYNEISDVAIKAGGQDNNAIDPDWRTTNILIQYNYIHDCGEGFLLCGVRFNSGVIRYNLVQDVTKSYVHYYTGTGYFQIYNNMFYRSADNEAATNNFDIYGNGSICSYVNNVFYDAQGEGFNFEGATSSDARPSMANNAYYGTKYNTNDESAIILEKDAFQGTAPAMTRKGTFATGALLEANGLMPAAGSALYTSGVTADGKKISLDDGLLTSGSKFNFTSLRENYDITSGTAEKLVYIARTDYPLFAATDAQLDTNPTQRTAAAPSVGLFERVLTKEDVILTGTVTDGLTLYADVTVTVTVNGKTATAVTDKNGAFRLTNEDGLTAGSATVTVTVNGKEYTNEITLEGAASQTMTIKVDLPTLPDPYPQEVLNEDFSDGAGVFTFPKGSKVSDGQLVIDGLGKDNSSFITFSDEIQSLSAVDFSFDYKFAANSNKSGLQFRDSKGNLLFATCIKNTELRVATAGPALQKDSDASTDSIGTSKNWINYTGTPGETYKVRVRADFAAGKVSYQIKDKDGNVIVQALDVDTEATNLAKMYICSWWIGTAQYIDNFVLTAPGEEPEPVVVDKTALKNAIEANADKAEEDYTAESWKDFADALATAKDVLADNDATQDEVDNAAKTLTSAAAALEEKPEPVVVNKAALEQAVSDNEDKVETDYTAESWKPFAEALAAAQDVLANADATQDEVDAATAALTKAAAALEAKPAPVVVDKTALKQAIDANADKNENDYTEASWTNFAKALAAAQDVLANPDATQDEVDAAAAALTKAAEALETKPAPVVVDKTALKQAIDANADKNENDYTEASWTNFAKALAAARDVLANTDATQEEVNAATNALTAAAAALKVKPTETPKPDTVTKVDNEPLSDTNIPDSLKEAGYDTPKKIEDKLKQESSQKLASDNLLVYDVTLKVSTDGGKTWQKATDTNIPDDGIKVSFDLPKGITAETADQYTFLISHMKDDATVELLEPELKDGKLIVTVHSLSPFGVSWKAKEQPKPTEQPTATPAPTGKPSNSSPTPKATAAPKAADAPKATAAPAAPIPQTADSFPLVMLAVLALCSAAALAGLTIRRSKKKH